MNNNTTVKVGVIGLGVMGMRHVQTCDELRGIELVGVADIKPDVAKRVSEQFGVQVSPRTTSWWKKPRWMR